MDTLEFLRQILPDSGQYVVAYTEPVVGADGKEGKKFCHLSFSSLEETAEKILELDKNEKCTVYHACASYQDFGKRVSRTADKTLEVKSFWLDLDCGKDKADSGKGYASQAEAFAALRAFVNESGFPSPLIVDSGYGLHCYWVLDKAIPVAEWKQTALKLKEVFKKQSIITDPSRTSDLASILRPVGSHNKKYGNSKLVSAKNGAKPVSYEVFKQRVCALLGDSDVLAELPSYLTKTAAEENSSLIHVASNYEYNADKVADRCAVMKHFRSTQGDLSYDAWRGAIGVLTFCKNGRELAHKWSEKRAQTGHENTDTDVRFDTWGSKPTSCAFFKEHCPELCKGCQNKFATPLHLGREVDTKEEPPVEVPEEQRPALPLSEEVHPEGYFWDTGLGAMAFKAYDKDGNEIIRSFTNYRFYLSGRVRDTSGEHFCIGVLYDPYGGRREFVVSAKAISAGGTALLSELGRAEISPSNTPNSEKLMVGYLRDSMNRLRYKVDVTRSFTSFGWQDDKESFLLGGKLYKKGVVDDKVRLRGYAGNKADIFKNTNGSIEEYSKALNEVYARPGMESMQYAMGSLWGAPLCGLVKDALYKGIPCALTGVTSGRGKTTAFTAALYAFGDAEKMTIKGEQGATPNARTAFLGAMQSLPVLIDEITNIKASELSNLAYVVSNGGEKDRLRMDRAGETGTAFVNTSTWCTQVGLTGNTCLIDRLSENGTSDAETMRIFEIRSDVYPVPSLDPMTVIEALSKMQANAGAVGPKYISYIMDNRMRVEALMAETMQQVVDSQYLAVEPKYRFYRWHMVTSITAIKIMNEIGVTHFDVDRVIEFAKEAVQFLCMSSQERNGQPADEILFEFMQDNSESILTTRRLDDIPADEIDRIPNRRYIARLIRGDRNVRDENQGLFIISRRDLSKWCLNNRYDRKKLEDDLEAMGLLWRRDVKSTITRGVAKLPSPQIRCDWVNLGKTLLKKLKEEDVV